MFAIGRETDEAKCHVAVKSSEIDSLHCSTCFKLPTWCYSVLWFNSHSHVDSAMMTPPRMKFSRYFLNEASFLTSSLILSI